MTTGRERAEPGHADAESAVRSLVSAYCMAIDDGRFDDLQALFTPGSRFHVMGSTHTGAAAIRAMLEAAQPPPARGRHHIGAALLDLDVAAGSGRGWVDYVFIDAGGAVTNLGRYHDVYHRDPSGRWVFDLREIVFRGARPELTPDWA